MANQQTDLVKGKLNQEQVLPMALGAISNGALETKRPVNPLMNNGKLTFNAVLDVPVNLVFEVGRTSISIKQLMELNIGSFVELRQVSVDTIDICINDKLYAYGETIALQQRYGIRFGELEIQAGVDDMDDIGSGSRS